MGHLVQDLDDKLYNTLPQQPPSKSGAKPSREKGGSKAKVPETGESSSTKSSTQDKAKPQQTLSDQPPPDNPLEEPNIWCTILKLEGRQHENAVAEGFQNWLRKNLDCSLFEVLQKKCFIDILF